MPQLDQPGAEQPHLALGQIFGFKMAGRSVVEIEKATPGTRTKTVAVFVSKPAQFSIYHRGPLQSAG